MSVFDSDGDDYIKSVVPQPAKKDVVKEVTLNKTVKRIRSKPTATKKNVAAAVGRSRTPLKDPANVKEEKKDAVKIEEKVGKRKGEETVLDEFRGQLAKIGSEVEQKVKKRFRMEEEALSSMSKSPEDISEAYESMKTGRRKIMEGIREKIQETLKQADLILQDQKQTEEKILRMSQSIQKYFGNLREQLSGDIDKLKETISEFEQEMETLEGKQDAEMKNHLEAMHKQIDSMQNKIHSDD